MTSKDNYSVMSGKDFNDEFHYSEHDIAYGRATFIKLTNETENHNGFQFKDGLNVDTHEFDENNPKTGIYFTTMRFIETWCYYKQQKMEHVRHVIIPDDAKVYVEDDHCIFKTDNRYE